MTNCSSEGCISLSPSMGQSSHSRLLADCGTRSRLERRQGATHYWHSVIAWASARRRGQDWGAVPRASEECSASIESLAATTHQQIPHRKPAARCGEPRSRNPSRCFSPACGWDAYEPCRDGSLQQRRWSILRSHRTENPVGREGLHRLGPAFGQNSCRVIALDPWTLSTV